MAARAADGIGGAGRAAIELAARATRSSASRARASAAPAPKHLEPTRAPAALGDATNVVH